MKAYPDTDTNPPAVASIDGSNLDATDDQAHSGHDRASPAQILCSAR